MTLNWMFKYDGDPIQFNLSGLADAIMPDFGLDRTEYEVRDDMIEGTPRIQLTKAVTPLRCAVYSIEVRPSRASSEVSVDITFHKLFVLPLLPTFFVSLMNGIDGWLETLFFYLLWLILFGPIALVMLYSSKDEIDRKIKTFANTSDSKT